MIKKGDKIVCITDTSNIQFFKYMLHEIYFVTKIREKITDKGHYYRIAVEDIEKNAWYFETIRLENSLYFYDYFMTLAEWRDKQINSIFENEG